MSRPLRLIVNADDYGLTDSVNDAVLLAHRAGPVTSTSVLANGPAFEAGLPGLLAAPGLGVGLHLCLVGGDPPVAPPASVATLLDRDGRLLASWRDFAIRAATGRIRTAHVRTELVAQHERLRAAGLQVDHLDGHQHLQLWPSVARVVADLAETWAVAGVRTPWSEARDPVGLGTRTLARRARRRLRRRGVTTTDLMVGLDGAARYADRIVPDLDALAAANARAPGLVAEMAVHVARPDDDALERYGWGFDYAGTLDALLGPDVTGRLAVGDIALESWATAAGRP